MVICLFDRRKSNFLDNLKVNPLSSDLLITFTDPRNQWEENWFAVSFEIACALLLYQMFKHAKKQGSDFHYLILASMISCACFEVIALVRPGYELWWYHPGIVNIIKRRVPSYAITLFTIAHYMAERLTRNTDLPALTRSLVSSIMGLLFLSPFLWMAQRTLLLTYHFDDPVFKDRLVDIPYIQLLVVILLFFHISHLFAENVEDLQPQERNNYNLTCCALQSGAVAAIYTIVEQYILYLLFKLIIQIHTGFCVLAAAVVLTWLAKNEIQMYKLVSISTTGIMQPLRHKRFWAVAAGLVFVTTLPLWLNISTLKSTNGRVELGECDLFHEISNTSPLEVTRRRFLCPEDVKNLTYDFHCLQPSEVSFAVLNNKKHYTICGKNTIDSFQIQMMAVYSFITLFIFHTIMRVSFTFEVQQKPVVVAKKLD